MRPHAYLTALSCAALALASPAVFALPAPFVGGETGVYFAHAGDTSGVAAELVSEARRRVLVAGYASVSPALAAALREARRRGVAVRVVLDRSAPAARYSGAAFLAEAGIEVAFARRAGVTRTPFIVVDDAVAIDTAVTPPARGRAPSTAGEGAMTVRALNVFRDVPQLAQAYTRTFWQWHRVASGAR
ncbi:MAG: phospholipase D-like domain-containing protein [Burkholderia gladioli]